MVAMLQESGYANGTINLALTILKSALKNAVSSGELSRNVATGITVKQEKHEITPLTAQQAQRLLETVYGHRNYALYYLALSLGLRQGELLGLHWADINLDKRTLSVRKSKSKAGIRTLTLPQHIIDVLRDHGKFQATERVLRDKTWEEHGLVFPNERGKPQAPQNLQDNYKRMLRKAGLPNIRFHDLRHTAATLMIEQGIHLKVIQEILGHSTLAMTADIYAHVSSDAVEDALDKMQFMK
jgi:integrase